MKIWKHTNSMSARFRFNGEGVRFYTSLLVGEEGVDIETENGLFHCKEQRFLCEELFLEVINMVSQEMAKSSLRLIWRKAEEIGIVDAQGFAKYPDDSITDFFHGICGLLELRRRGEKVGIYDVHLALDD